MESEKIKSWSEESVVGTGTDFTLIKCVEGVVCVVMISPGLAVVTRSLTFVKPVEEVLVGGFAVGGYLIVKRTFGPCSANF